MVVGRFIGKEVSGHDGLTPLVNGPKGWLCSEGQRIILRTQTTHLPKVRSSGVTVDQTQLEQVADGFEARFEFLIDSWAGRMSLELCVGDVICDQLTLDIRPSDNKLNLAEFDAMLEELAARSPSLAWGLSQGNVSGRESRDAPNVVHPIVVDVLLPQFERLMGLFLANPPVRMLQKRELAPFDFTRRSDVSTLRSMARRPELLASLRNKPSGLEHRRKLIDQPARATSFDHPVTRYFAHLIQRLIRRLGQSSVVLRQRSGLFADPVTDAHAEALAQRLDKARGRLENISQHRILHRANREPPGETAVQFIGNHPLYSAIQRLGRRLLEPGLAYDLSGDLEAALKRTYDLFELFTLYRLVDALKERLGEGWQLAKVKQRAVVKREERPANQASWWFVGPNYETVELRYQQWFSRAKSIDEARNFGSLSGANVPDYIIIRRRGGDVVSWVILDAKYRASRQPIDQGLGDIHRYRDALRVKGTRADGAFIIVPRVSETNAIYASSLYHSTHHFGVLQMSNAGWSEPIAKTLGL